jgi:hypothetical protein
MLASRIRSLVRKFGGAHGVVYEKAPMVADQL